MNNILVKINMQMLTVTPEVYIDTRMVLCNRHYVEW